LKKKYKLSTQKHDGVIKVSRDNSMKKVVSTIYWMYTSLPDNQHTIQNTNESTIPKVTGLYYRHINTHSARSYWVDGITGRGHIVHQQRHPPSDINVFISQPTLK